MNKLFVLIGAAGALTGCVAPVQSPIVEKPGATPEQINRDMAECRNNPPAFALGNYIVNCMKEKGYTILTRYN
jgi:hypothetical protein